jgi:8-oxo-dGTP diphosphatase
MKTKLSFAQKGLILDKTKTKLLAIKYGDAKYTPDIIDKYGLPGGKMDFGESPDQSLIREVKEETGITINPGKPYHVYSWTYKKGQVNQQIVALARLGLYKNGKILTTRKTEKETNIESIHWLDVDKLNNYKFTKEETPIIQKFIESVKKNLLEI